MNLFAIDPKAGAPLYEQELYAARKAILSGELKPGDAFPSVREIAGHLRINPNTVQKALAALKAEGLVETVPGIGNRVCERPEPRAAERAALLDGELEALVMRVQQLRLTLTDLNAALQNHWNRGCVRVLARKGGGDETNPGTCNHTNTSRARKDPKSKSCASREWAPPRSAC